MANIKSYDYSPYNAPYDSDKNYVQPLFCSGNYSQARELTELGLVSRDYLGRIGDAIFKNGQIIVGCQAVIDTTRNILTISAGSLYLDGLVRKIKDPINVAIFRSGVEYIGVKIEESIVTAAQDSSLRNPAVGTESFNLEGAHRIKHTVVAVRFDDTNKDKYQDIAVLYTLKDGEIMDDGSVTDDDDTYLSSRLAKRTFDVSGNFKVEGLYLENKDTSDPTDPDYGKSQLYLGAGRAYIYGYHVSYATMRVIDCEIPKTRAIKQSEPHKVSTNLHDRTYLSVNPVESITKLRVTARRTRQITRGEFGDDYDPIDSNIIAIEKVWDNEKHPESDPYVYERDYTYDTEGIYWNPLPPDGDEPDKGDSFNVMYRLNVNLESISDFLLKEDPSQGWYFEFTDTCISETQDPRFSKCPLIGTMMDVDYKYYLSRLDTYTLNSKGEVGCIKGVPAVADRCIAPPNNDPTLLTLGYVLNYANSTRKEIKNLYTIRLTQADIYGLKKRIDDLEYNIAMQDLDHEAAEGEDATLLKGIYTDGFMGFTKCDVSYDRSGVKWNGSIDLDQQEFTVASDIGYSDVPIDVSASTAQVLGRIISAPYTQEVGISQLKATNAMLVNPYAVWKDLSLLRVEPAKDTWVSNEKITIDGGTTTQTYTLRKWWEYSGASWVQEEQEKWQGITGSTRTSDGTYDSTKYTYNTNTVTQVDMYMRGRVVKFTAMNFDPSEFPIKLTFNSKEIEPFIPNVDTPIDDHGYHLDIRGGIGEVRIENGWHTLADGSNSQTGHKYCMADANGNVEGYFDIPDKEFPCGTVEVKLVGTQSMASTTYTATGNVVTEVTTVRAIRTVVEAYDPLAQTFSFPNASILTGFDFYFATVDQNRGVVVQVRDVVNGYPGTTVYDEVMVPVTEINHNPDRPDYENPTRVTLNQTVYCEGGQQYAVVILSDVNTYSMWTAELGGTDKVTGVKMTSNPYLSGVMFSSSNGLAWTAHQDQDLTFQAYRAKYNPNGGIVEFNDIDVEQAVEMVTAVEVEDQKNNLIDWFYREKDESVWYPMNTFSTVSFPDYIETVSLRAHIHCSESTSPVIAKDSVTLAWLMPHNNATYISRGIALEEPFEDIKVQCQLCLPTGSDYNVYVCLDDDVDPSVVPKWYSIKPYLQSGYPRKENGEFSIYLFQVPIHTLDATLYDSRRYRIRVDLTAGPGVSKPRMRRLMSVLRNQPEDPVP